MKWKGRRQSDNVEDRRGMSSGSKTLAGGGIRAYNIIDKCFEVKIQINATFRTNKSRRKHDDRTKGSNCKRTGRTSFYKNIVADNEDVWTTISRKTI
jgi:predicted metalloprotease